jgi:acyl-coenzyme A thioesterase PaaI-like protein
MKSLQELHGPTGICFGCGPANAKGLRIRSFPNPAGDGLVCEWQPELHHQAFQGTLNGGIIGALLDCHGNWTAAWHLMKADGLSELPSTVTSEFTVKLTKPTPMTGPVRLASRVVERDGSKVTVEETLEAGGRVTATCRGVFVSVPPGHPAYHRWGG